MTQPRISDRRLFLLLDRAQHALFKEGNRRLAESAGLSVSLGAALFFLGRHNGCRLSELADGLGLNRSAVTALAAKLEDGGYAKRVDPPNDRRSTRLVLTETGREKREIVVKELRRFNDEISERFTEAELDVVFRFLTSIVTNPPDARSAALHPIDETSV